jgi:ABC-2 type transport system permease protein
MTEARPERKRRSTFWTPLLAVARKEVIQTSRDPRMMALLIIAPALQLFVFGNAADLDVDHVPSVVVDRDHTPTSRAHLQALFADGTLIETMATDDPDEAGRMLIAGEASVAIIVAEGFERDLARGREPARVQALVDGSDPNRSAVAGSAVGRYFTDAAQGEARARLARAGVAAPRLPTVVELAPRVLYNPHLETAVNLVPGIATMLLLIVTTIVTAMGLTRERESGTLEQVLVTPVRPMVLILGKMIPFAIIGLFDFLLAVTVGAYAFDVPVRGSLWLLFGATALYLLTTLSAGLLISTVSQTQQQAFLGGFMFMLPAALLSGIMTPVRSMPGWLQPLTVINPLRHYADLLRAVLLRAAGVGDVMPQLLILAGFGIVLATLATLRFQKTTE